MARLSSLKDTWAEYKGWVILFFTVYVLWSFRGLFSTANDNLQAQLEAATAQAKANAEDKVKKVQAAANAPALKKRGIKAGELEKWDADARALAVCFGTVGGNGITSVAGGLADQDGAFKLLKQNYSRLLLYDNKPVRKNPKTGKHESQARETPESIKNPVNWTVLIGPYKTVTGGNDLRTDIRKYLKAFWLQKYLIWVI